MSEAPEGVIIGGWPYAIAAYAITVTVLTIYAWTLVTRMKKALNPDHQED